MQLANSPVTPPSIPNKQLYNGGSEWQSDYTGNLPDYYQTFNRNYDAALGRFIGVDPKAESAESMTSYQYAGNNPILYNDPLGDLLPMPGSHTPPPVDYSSSQLLPNTGPLDANWQNSAAMGGVYNLYGTNPDAYWDLYNSGALAGGDGSIYHAGDGTSADPHTGMDASTLVALTSGTASYSLDFTTNVWEIKSNTAEANNYGEIRGGVTIYDFGILKPADRSPNSAAENNGLIPVLLQPTILTPPANFPANDGFVGPGPRGEIAEGTVIDRFGETYPYSRYFSPKGTPLSLRNLLKGVNEGIYQSWRVVKPFNVRGGGIMGEDGLPTGGIQFRSDLTVGQLTEGGYIEPIEPVEIPEVIIF